jgi:hypothetical protein
MLTTSTFAHELIALLWLPALAFFLFGPALIGWKKGLPESALWMLAIGAAFSLGIGAAFGWWYVLTRPEKKRWPGFHDLVN